MPSAVSTELRSALNIILRTLERTGQTDLQTLVVQMGVGAPEIARAIYKGKKNGWIAVRSDNGSEQSTYRLTHTGQQVVPPQYIKDLSVYEPPKNAGLKHVHGIVGKNDYSKPLRGGVAILYDALTKPMSIDQWSIAANLQPKAMYLYIEKLEKLKIVSYIEQQQPNTKRTVKVYSRARDMLTENTLPEPEPPPDKTNGGKATTTTPPAIPYVSHFSKPAMSLDEAVAELGQRYSAFDICLAALALLEDRHKQLIELSEHVKKHFGDKL